MAVNRKPQLPQWIVNSLPIVGLWTLIGTSFSLSMYFTDLAEGQPITWRRALTWNLLNYYLWMVISPLIIELARKYPFKRNHWLRSISVHVPASAVFSTIHALIYFPLYLLLDPQKDGFYGTLSIMLHGTFIFRFHFGIITYWAILAVISAKHERTNSAKLQAQLAEAQLQALRMQLHPHFLFNTLHSISALILDDPVLAKRMISLLGDFLRMTLESSGDQYVAFSVELEFLKRYLAIEQVRFQDRLSIDMKIDPATLKARVPNLILQPLVENAIRHGIAPRLAPGRIDIRARQLNGSLQLQIQDDGLGLQEGTNGSDSKGLGLSNTRARLQQLYGSDYRFELSSANDGGVIVTMEIPFQDSNVTQTNAHGAGQAQ